MTTNEYLREVKASGWPPVRKRLWQRNYYEHVIRGEESLNRVRNYIRTNPARWLHDRLNPAASAFDAEDPWNEREVKSS